ncbi:MAG: sigma-70 family RNA polymerase sigma factor [Verrucomicrobiota bacterium]
MTDPSPIQENFLRIFLLHENDLRAYARALLPNWDAVGEVMQEASVVMWRKLDQLDDESGFLPWAKVIVRYEALKARQKVARDRLCFGEDVYELLADDSADDVNEVLSQERDALGVCLGKLDTSQRELVLLPYHGHGAITEIAEKSGQTVNSLYKKIGRLRAKLTQCVQNRLTDPSLKGETI